MKGVAGVHKGVAGVQGNPSKTEFHRSPFSRCLWTIDLFLVALLSLLFAFAY